MFSSESRYLLCEYAESAVGRICSGSMLYSRALLIANHQLQLVKGENTKLLEANTEQAEQIKGMLPKASYYDYVLSAEDVLEVP